jgi:hypothetical protein
VLAPGHLGELTRLVPFEMLDDVLATTRRTESRVRLLPARVVMYLLLAGCLFADLGSALRQARQRLGPQPVQALFELLRGPAATSAPEVRWRGLLLSVIDATFLSVADSAANTGRYAKQRGDHGGSGYLQLRLSALLSCGTRSIIDAVFDPVSVGESDQARHLARSLQAGMLLLADRNYAGADLITTLAATGAHLLIRCKSGANCRSCADTTTVPSPQSSVACGSGSSMRRSASTAAHRDGRRHRQPARPRPRPGQLHHSLEHRSRPDRPRRRDHRRHCRRPRRCHRHPRLGPPAARPPDPRQIPHDQTLELQIPSPRPDHRPTQLPSHHQHQTRPFDNQHTALTERRWA